MRTQPIAAREVASRTLSIVISALGLLATSPATEAALLPQPGSLVVTMTSPPNGSTVSGTVTVSANVSALGVLVGGVQFKLDGANLGAEDRSAPYSISWNTATVGNGSHTLKAVARDALGIKWHSDPITVRVSNGPPPDTTPPSVTLTSPQSGQTVSGTITVSASASDDVGVTSVRFELDGSSLGAEDTTAPYSVSWNTATASNGSHTLRAIARDAAGNSGASQPIGVTMDNASPPPPPPTGDLFVSLRDGKIRQFAPDGTFLREMVSPADGTANGMAFDADRNLYVTLWFGNTTPGNTVAKFDTDGNLLGTFGSGYDSNPSSIVFGSSGNAYVGLADGTHDVVELSPAGDRLASHDVAVQHRGADWVELDPDQCTLLYTSRDFDVLRYDACTGTQLTPFNSQPLPHPGFALRLLPGGDLLVATMNEVTRLDSSGAIVQTYDVPGEPDLWLGLDLVGDGTFWVSNLGSSNLYRFEIDTGAVLGSFNAGTPSLTVNAVAVRR